MHAAMPAAMPAAALYRTCRLGLHSLQCKPYACSAASPFPSVYDKERQLIQEATGLTVAHDAQKQISQSSCTFWAQLLACLLHVLLHLLVDGIPKLLTVSLIELFLVTTVLAMMVMLMAIMLLLLICVAMSRPAQGD